MKVRIIIHTVLVLLGGLGAGIFGWGVNGESFSVPGFMSGISNTVGVPDPIYLSMYGYLGAMQYVNDNNIVPGVTLRPSLCNTSLTLPPALYCYETNMANLSDALVGVGPPLSASNIVTGVQAQLSGPPLVSYSAGSSELTNSFSYPQFLRLIGSIDQYGLLMAAHACWFGWKSVAIVQLDSLPIYPYVSQYGMEMCNLTISASVTFLSSAVDTSELAVEQAILTLKGSNARVIIVTSLVGFETAFLEAAAKNGLAGDKYVWLGITGPSTTAMALDLYSFSGFLTIAIETPPTPMRLIFDEYIVENKGGFIPNESDWKMMKEYVTDDSTMENSLFAWDCVLTIANALNDLSTAGESLRFGNGTIDHRKFRSFMGKAKFDGASGPVSFFQTSNNRNVTFGLRNLITVNGTMEEVEIAKVTMLSEYNNMVLSYTHNNLTDLFAFEDAKEIHWLSGQSTPALDWAVNQPTPGSNNIPVYFTCDPTGCVEGQGECIAADTCKCFDRWTGKTCNTLSYLEWEDTAVIIYLGIGAFLFVGAAATAVLVFVNRKNPVIKRASPLFCMLMSGGILVAYISILFYIGRPTDFLCMGRPWFSTLGFSMIFTNLLTKTLRISRIFNNSKLKRSMKLTDGDMLKFSLKLNVIPVVILIVWTASFPLRAQPPEQLTGTNEYWSCESSSSVAELTFGILLFSYVAMCLIVASILAFRTRNVSDLFNEASLISYCVYISVFVLFLWALLNFFLLDEPLQRYIVTSTSTFCIATTVLVVVLSYKLYIIYYGDEEQIAKARTSAEAACKTCGSTSPRPDFQTSPCGGLSSGIYKRNTSSGKGAMQSQSSNASGLDGVKASNEMGGGIDRMSVEEIATISGERRDSSVVVIEEEFSKSPCVEARRDSAFSSERTLSSKENSVKEISREDSSFENTSH
eukprot:Nk52_evm29s2340 gene=Nk52_evmTU29s2340